MMNRRIFVAAAAIFLVAAGATAYIAATPRLDPAPAQASSGAARVSDQQSTSDANTGISVTGQGRVFVTPDIATATIGVDITTATLAQATSQANTQMTAVIAKIKSLGVADKDIRTLFYNVSPITSQTKEGTAPAITGYRVTNQVVVTVRKLDDLGAILDGAVGAGANTISGISFTIEDPTPYQQQARAAAVKDAMDKAAQLAKDANVQLGKVISIDEGAASPRPIAQPAAVFAAGAASVPVETGQMEIDVTVDMRIAIQ